MKSLGWIGTVCALSGAVLVAANVPASGLGFVLFLASSLAWLWVAWARGDGALALMQAGFTAINMVGVYRWILLPLALGVL